MEAQQSTRDPVFQVESDRLHVAQNLWLRFFKRKIQTALASRTCGMDEVGCNRTFAGAGRSRHSHAASTIYTLIIEHGVELGNTGGHAIHPSLMVEAERRDRQDREA